MKYLLLIGLGLIAFITSSAQVEGMAKLFGFKEEVIGGVNPSHIEENGEQVNRSSTGLNYYIYLQSASRVYPSEIWINGQPFGASFHTVTTPVERQEFNHPDSGKTVLVPKTNEKLLQLVPIAAVESKLTQKGKSLAAKNELVVIYKQDGRFYYNVLDRLKPLVPVALQ